MQSYNHAVMQSCSHTVMQSYSHAVIQSFSHTVMQSYSHTIMLIDLDFIQTVMQSFSHADIQSCIHTAVSCIFDGCLTCRTCLMTNAFVKVYLDYVFMNINSMQHQHDLSNLSRYTSTML